MIRNTVLRTVLALLLGGAASRCLADGCSLTTVGVRGGFSADANSTGFAQVEALGTFDLPWRRAWETGWQAQWRLALSAGSLLGHDEQGFVGTVGPNLLLGYKDVPVHLDLGISPTILSRYEYGETSFGIPFQFTSYAGLGWDCGRHFSVGYRYQHMSNAHLSSHNPGLNLHAFAISYRF